MKQGISFHKTTLYTVGVLLVLLAAVLLLWQGNANSMQAEPAVAVQVYFEGEYRIADGDWHPIEKGQHISSTQGDVTLRGHFHQSFDGEYLGLYNGDIPIAFYMDHINITVYEENAQANVMDVENAIYGESACGAVWDAYKFTSGSTQPIEMVIHNPHRFGNETAIDDFLAGIALWTGMDFEKNIMARGEVQNSIGMLFLIVSLVFLGVALFSTLIHIKHSPLLWIIGGAIVFAGMYLTYSTQDVALRHESTVSNTVILGCSMMLYMLFLSMTLVYMFKVAKRAGVITVTALGLADTVLFVLPMLTDILFYDMWLYWALAQLAANLALIVCSIKECSSAAGKWRWLYIGAVLPLMSFGVDVAMTKIGVWQGGWASVCVFTVLFVTAIVAVLRIIPHSINALAKAKESETEKIMLRAQLTESRMSTMMSQIRPHFIYNTLGSIEQLCVIDPPKARELVHNFAKYLRGNFGELDNPTPILMSQEMEHVHHYISIEHVRFPDMTFLFEMKSNDFKIPALSIQPIVENAIKHGLMKLEKGGTIRVVTYETDEHYCVSVEDDGVGFDTSVLSEDRQHVGIRNIRGRLRAMVNGTLDIESTVGVGTKVLIAIPKEVRQ